MGIIVDIITVLVLLASIYMGYKRGIIEVGFKLFALIVSLVVSIMLYSPITHFVVDNTGIDEKIEEVIIEKGTAKAEKTETNNSSIDSYVQNLAKETARGAQNAVVESSARTVAVNIVGIFVMLGLFIGIRIALTVLKIFTNIIAKLPLIKECNEIVGLAYGAIRGLFIVYAILAITFFVTSMTGKSKVNDAIDGSHVTKFFYDNNIIMMLV